MKSAPLTPASAIPRMIHQTWKTAEVPPRFLGFVESWKRHHPGWTYKLWTDADNDAFVLKHAPEFLATFRGYRSGIERADAIRYLLLLHEGGVYADLDFECLAPLDSVLQGHRLVLGTEPHIHAHRLHGRTRLVCNAVMAAAPGHPFWPHLLKELVARAASSRGGDPVESTGPKVLDDALGTWRGEAVFVTNPDVFYPLPDVESPSLQLSAKERTYFRTMAEHRTYPKQTVAVHHWSHTWIKAQGFREQKNRLLGRMTEWVMALRGRITIDEVLRPERYGVAFPEEAFRPRPERVSAYEAELAQAKLIGRERRIVFAVLVHNRIDLIPVLRRRIEHLGESFADWSIVVYGLDSTDGTAEALKSWAEQEPRVILPATVTLEATGIARIAMLRNCLLDSAEMLADVDAVVMLDGDLAGPVSRDGLVRAVARLGQADRTACVSAYGVNNYVGLDRPVPFVGFAYYDTFAFRVEHQERRGDWDVRSRFFDVRRGDSPIAVDSAFGGCAVYDANAARGLRYETSGDDCEHVSLHRRLRQLGFVVLVDPSFLLLSGRQGHHEGVETL